MKNKSTITLDWNWIDSAGKTLASMIKRSKFKPKSVLAIARGGLVLGTILSHHLDLPIAVIGARRYAGRNVKFKKARIIGGLSGKFLEPTLVVDDVADEGQTLVDVVEKMKLKKYEIATLHYKPWSIVKPRFYMDETNSWVCYPWCLE